MTGAVPDGPVHGKVYFLREEEVLVFENVGTVTNGWFRYAGGEALYMAGPDRWTTSEAKAREVSENFKVVAAIRSVPPREEILP